MTRDEQPPTDGGVEVLGYQTGLSFDAFVAVSIIVGSILLTALLLGVPFVIDGSQGDPPGAGEDGGINQTAIDQYAKQVRDDIKNSSVNVSGRAINPPTRNVSGWWRDADRIMWIAADSEPVRLEPELRERHRNATDGDSLPYTFNRLNATMDDLDGLPFTPDYSLLVGDIAQPSKRSNVTQTPIQNIRAARASYDRLSWFEPGANTTMVLDGNEEIGHAEAFSRVFDSRCGEADRVVQMNTSMNLVVLGACGEDAYQNETIEYRIPYGESWLQAKINISVGVKYPQTLPDLEERLPQISDGTNVFVATHHPIPNSVSNCHVERTDGVIYWMIHPYATKFRDLLRANDGVVSAMITGHLHGRWQDKGVNHLRTRNLTYLDAPVTGQTPYSGGDCNDLVGAGDSMFLAFENGSDTAEIYIRHSCDDLDIDGDCDRDPYWTYGGNLTLDNSIQRRTIPQ